MPVTSNCQDGCVDAIDDAIQPAPYFGIQRRVHQLLACFLLIPALPAIGLVVLLVRSTSKGAGIYRQTRVGRHGKIFMLYKVRTMDHDAEHRSGPVWSSGNDDPRITPLGRILRKLHLDELPQIWNVIRGEMSLVGPRPERPEFVQKLARQIPGYMNRLSVAPGITGLAQINLPPDTDLEDVRRKLELDVEYIRHGTFWLDVRVLACTALRFLGFPGYPVIRFMGLRRIPPRMLLPVRASDDASIECVSKGGHSIDRGAADRGSNDQSPCLSESVSNSDDQIAVLSVSGGGSNGAHLFEDDISSSPSEPRRKRRARRPR